jgi:hypothetical protein
MLPNTLETMLLAIEGGPTPMRDKAVHDLATLLRDIHHSGIPLQHPRLEPLWKSGIPPAPANFQPYDPPGEVPSVVGPRSSPPYYRPNLGPDIIGPRFPRHDPSDFNPAPQNFQPYDPPIDPGVGRIPLDPSNPGVGPRFPQPINPPAGPDFGLQPYDPPNTGSPAIGPRVCPTCNKPL